MRKSRIGWFIAGTLSLGLLRAGAETPSKPSAPGPLAIQDSPPLLRVPEAPASTPASEASNAAAPSMPAPEQKPPKPAPPAASAEPTPVPSVPFSTKTPSSISTNKQFHVFGGDLQLRGAFCMLCEDTANLLGRVLKDGGDYKLPIFVVLRTPPDIELTGPPVTLGISELSYGGFHLQINAQYRTGFQPEDFTRELVRLLLAERILRNHKRLSATREGDVLPAWVMTGVSQALEYRSRSRPSALFLAVFKRGDVFSLDRIFSANPTQLDALNRGIYEMSSCALVLTLLDQPDGPVRFARFLNDLAVASKADRDLLTQHFPNLATSKSSLEKWWTLQMASLATPTAMDSLTASQTEDELDNALMLQIPTSQREPAVAAKPKPKPAPPTPVPSPQPTQSQPAKPTAPDTVVKSESKEEPQAESTERRPRNFFGWMKRGSKDEAKGEEKPEGKTDEKSKPAEPQKAPDKKSAAIDGQGGEQGAKLVAVVDVGSVILAMETFDVEPYLRAVDVTGFFGGEKVALFKKKEKPADETAEAAKGQETPKEPEKGKGKAADEKKTSASTPAPAPVEPAKPEKKRRGKKDDEAKAEPEKPTPALSRKPGEARSIGTRPEDLPKAPPPAPVTEKKNEKAERPPEDHRKKEKEPEKENSEPPKKEEEAKPEHRGIRSWFRKDSDGKEKPGETKDTPPQEPPKNEGKSEGAGTRVASRPAPAPAPKTRAPKPGTIPLEDFTLIAKRSDREEILSRCSTRLNALMLRAHPLYKPVISDYTTLVQEMIDGKTRNAAEKLETLRRQRDAVREKSAAIESYLDWYEANHTARLSHEFDDFLRLDGQLEKDRLPRNDSVSKALDSAQKEFGR